MKEPWEVYHDEFWREIKRRSTPDTSGEGRTMSEADATKALHSAMEATAYHLIEVERLRKDQALDLVGRFQKSMTDGEVDEWRSRMRDIWTDWRLMRL